MPGPRLSRKCSSAIRLRAAQVRPLQLGEIHTQFALVDFFLVSL